MKKTQEQFTVICDGLFLNDEKPAKWDYDFPWEPSVGFHYRPLDESGEPVGEGQKKYLKKMWFFQAMGGRNAKGKYFRLEAEHGEVPAKEGKPAKPYTTITPLAEVFADGTAFFLEAPKDGKISTPPPGKTSGPVKPAGPKVDPQAASAQVPPKGGPANPPPPAKPTVGVFADPNTKKVAHFFEELEKSQSDSWWLFKTQLGYDGADASNILDHAKQMALIEVSNIDFSNYQGEEMLSAMRSHALKSIDFWSGVLRLKLLSMKFNNVRDRLIHYVSLTIGVNDLDLVLKKAWAELPDSEYQKVRQACIGRLKILKEKTVEGVFKGTITGTLQPEVNPQSPAPTTPAPEEEAAVEDEETAGAGEYRAPDPPPAPTEEEIKFTVRGINNITDYDKLLKFWSETKGSLQAVKEVQESMKLWILNVFMEAKYQANVDGMREKFPKHLMTPDLEKALHSRYAELSTF